MSVRASPSPVSEGAQSRLANSAQTWCSPGRGSACRPAPPPALGSKRASLATFCRVGEAALDILLAIAGVALAGVAIYYYFRPPAAVRKSVVSSASPTTVESTTSYEAGPTEVSQFALVAVACGACAIAASVFLPLASVPGGDHLAHNTLFPSFTAFWLLFWAVAIVGACVDLRQSTQGPRKRWAAFSFGFFAAVLGGKAGYNALQLYPIGPGGVANTSVTAETANAGIGVIVGAAGLLLVLAGGCVLGLGIGEKAVAPQVATAATPEFAKPIVPDIAATANPHNSVTPVSSTTKRCPDCAEQIQAAAHVCRYCGFRFSDV